MEGLIVQHRVYGYGKVVAVVGRNIRIRFCETGQSPHFAPDAFARGDLKHAKLNIDERAVGPHGSCVIVRTPPPATPNNSTFSYGIRYDDGLTATVSEVDLTPVSLARDETPIGRLSSYRPHARWKLVAREGLMNALFTLGTQVGGLRGLLASRVDLHPHQAYVAGSVILDRHRRYILADEVGLGKTIEAGVVIHDLLLQKPNARVLILTPGALCRQWLCEMHSGFGGQGFRLLDLYASGNISLPGWPRVICSTALAVRGLANRLADIKWDLVVVDEVHHLIGNELLYGFVQSPARMFEAIPHSEFRIAYAFRAIHRLEKEVSERQPFKEFRFRALLWKHQLQFIPVTKHEFTSGLRADAYPIDPPRSGMSTICLDGHLYP